MLPVSASLPSAQTPTPLEKVLEEFKDVFEELPPGLPPDRGVPHVIPLEPGAVPPKKRMYRLSPAERAEAEKTIGFLLAQKWVETSQSPYGSPILFALKADGSLRMCVDYRALNKL
jgi:hypothetical protein